MNFHHRCPRWSLQVFVALLLSWLPAGCPGGEAPKAGPELLREDFQKSPSGMKLPGTLKPWGELAVVAEGGQAWLKLNGKGGLAWDVILDERMTMLKFTCRMRTAGVTVGAQNWEDARVGLEFLDAAGKHTGSWLAVPHAKGDTEWTSFAQEYPVPAGAKGFRVSPMNLGTGGVSEFDDLLLTVARVREPVRDEPAPAGFVPDPGLERAQRINTATQERVCLNSLWAFFPVAAAEQEKTLPAAGQGWGWFKIPGIWPRKSSWGVPGTEQSVFIAAGVKDAVNLEELTAAWYKRTIRVPADWTGRQMYLDFRLLQSYAQVRVDGAVAGEAVFPGGRVDLSKALKPGKEQELAILVRARPLAKGRTIFMAPDRSFTEEGSLNIRGITGDLYLESEPAAGQPHLWDVRVRTSLRNKTVTFDFAARDIPAGAMIEADAKLDSEVAPEKLRNVTGLSKFFEPVRVDPAQMQNGRLQVTAALPDWVQLWDTGKPENKYYVTLSLKSADGGKSLAASMPVRAAFREFRIDGRDFYLNDKRIHLRAMVLNNASMGAGQADYAACTRTLSRLKEYGYNFFITSNYNFAAGEVGYPEGLLMAADDLGVLNAFSMPHVKDFEWKLNDPQMQESYKALADRLLQLAANHPSVVLYTMNHNATGYKGDQNPQCIDGVFSPDNPEKGQGNKQRVQALQAANLVKQLDPSRPVYHHQSGNLGDMYTINTYLNWSPRQERSDWLEHWQEKGVKPLFFVEWGLPHVASWSSYRGPNFIWRTPALQQVWDAEFAAAYKGAAAYQPDPKATALLLRQQELYQKGEPFAWGSILGNLRGREFNYYDIQSWFAADNWRSHRARGISSMLPWDQEGQWKLCGGYNEPARPEPDALKNLEQPGIVPDLRRHETVYLYAPAGAKGEPTSLGQTFLRWNKPLCAFLGGAIGDFSEKSHNVRPGQTVRKSIVILNDERQPVQVAYKWNLADTNVAGEGRVEVMPGGRADVPVEFRLPNEAKQGQMQLRCEVRFSGAIAVDDGPGGRVQTDAFALDVLVEQTPLRMAAVDAAATPPAAAQAGAQAGAQTTTPSGARGKVVMRGPSTRVLFDGPEKATGDLLARMDVLVKLVDEEGLPQVLADPELKALIIGRHALTMATKLPGLAQRVRDGLRVLVMEQSSEVLANRLGFRIQEMGLREVFATSERDPLLNGLTAENLRDWAGASTLNEPYFADAKTDDPEWNWCGFSNTRVWRCGNRGNVASVLIEKPERGNFRPVLVGGFDLQYAPLMECREGRGRILFCQIDVSGRTADDPASLRLMESAWVWACAAGNNDLANMQELGGALYYSGDDKGRQALQKLGASVIDAREEKNIQNGIGHTLVLGPGFSADLDLKKWLPFGQIVTLGLNAADATRVLQGQHSFVDIEAMAIPSEGGLGGKPEWRKDGWRLERMGGTSADLYWRGKLRVAAPNETASEGVMALTDEGFSNATLLRLQAAPWHFAEQDANGYFRKSERRSWYMLARILNGFGVSLSSPLLSNLESPGKLAYLPLVAGWSGKVDLADEGRNGKWFAPEFAAKDWKTVGIPGTFEQQFPEQENVEGHFWYRKEFDAPASCDGSGLTLYLGAIDDESWVWLNGKFLGEITAATNPKDHWMFPRQYALQAGDLKPGAKNQLTVLVRNIRGSGGMRGFPAIRGEGQWLHSYYLQAPQAGDDPYRYYRW